MGLWPVRNKAHRPEAYATGLCPDRSVFGPILTAPNCRCGYYVLGITVSVPSCWGSLVLALNSSAPL